jgi:hypothetical protein
MRFATALMLWIAAAASAMAQPASPPTERVIVTADKEVPRKVLDDFIAAQAAPTRTLDKMARWKMPVCPMAVGVPKDFARFVEGRIRALAAEVGAPVGEAACKQNVSIIFTPEPQAIVHEIRRKNSAFLGYHQSTAQGDQLAQVTHPLQAWHMTGTRDLRGNLEADNPRGQTNTLVLVLPNPAPPPDMYTMYLPNARAGTVTGGHLADGLTSEFTHVLIVADVKWAAGPQIGTIADAMAVMALSRVTLPDSCRSLPSILDILAKDCPRGAGTKAITQEDLAFLQALYRASPDAILAKQKDEMAFKMQQAMTGQ